MWKCTAKPAWARYYYLGHSLLPAPAILGARIEKAVRPGQGRAETVGIEEHASLDSGFLAKNQKKS
jgi:hypothetical protein